MISYQDRFDRLNRMIAEDLILRKKWTDKDEQGREKACLLAALSPEAGKEKSPVFCPASLMPRWLAILTPWIDDWVSSAYWSEMIREYAWMISRIHFIPENKMNRLDYECRLIALEEARSHVPESEHEILKMIDGVSFFAGQSM